MPVLWKSVLDAFADFGGLGTFGLAGLLAGGSAGAALLLFYFVLRDRINPFRRAKDHAERGHLRRALALLAVELHRNPANRRALLMRADIERDRGLYAEAEEDYYTLVDLKKPGDGIEPVEVKKRLIPVLYGRGKLLAALKTVREVLSAEESSPDALHHLGLLMLGQLHYMEAWQVLERVIGSRPRMAPALLAASVALVPLKEFGKAVELARRAGEIDDDPRCALVTAAARYFMGSVGEAARELAAFREGEDSFDSPGEALFYHRLAAFCALEAGSFDPALEHLEKVLRVLKRGVRKESGANRPAVSPVAPSGIYDQFGRLDKKGKSPRRPQAAAGGVARDFFRLKEVMREEGLRLGTSSPAAGNAGTGRDAGASGGGEGGGTGSSGTLLDLEGLTPYTRAALDAGFALVKAGRFARARDIFEGLLRTNPEVIGLRGLLELVREKEGEPYGGGASPPGDIRGRTERVVAKKLRRYELWEYLERWEEGAIRPFHLVDACGFVARKRLDPRLLFGEKHV